MSKAKLILCMLLTITTILCVVASADAGFGTNLVPLNPQQSSNAHGAKPVGASVKQVSSHSTLVSVPNIVPFGRQEAKKEEVPSAHEPVKPQMTQEELELAQVNVCVPVIMYHSITKDPALQSEYCITDTLLESDFIAYKNAGFTPIDMHTYLQLTEAYRAAASAQPMERAVKLDALRTMLKKYPNPILLTFDDGYEDWYTILYPLAVKHDVKVNLSLVGFYCDGKGVFLDGEQIQEMAMCDLISFGNHTNNLHDVSNETLQQMYALPENRTLIATDYLDCEELIKTSTGRKSAFMSYPYGMQSEMTEAILNDMGLQISLATNVTARLPQLSDGTRIVPRINRVPWSTSSEFVESIIAKAKAQNDVAYAQSEALLTPVIGVALPDADKGLRPIRVEKNGVIYNFEGKLNGDATVLAMQNLRNIYPEIAVTYNPALRAYNVQLFDKNVTVDYINGTLSCDDRTMQMQQISIAQLPVRALFEVAGFHVTYNATDKTIDVFATEVVTEVVTETETVVMEPGV